MKKNDGLIIWTPCLAEVNGQNIITKQVVDLYGCETVEYRSGAELKSILMWVVSVLSLYNLLIKCRIDTIYIVNSRSIFGFVRDLPVLVLAFRYRVVLHCHGSDILNLMSHRIVGKLVKLLYRQCRIIVPSGHVFDALGRTHNVTLVENFASLSTSAASATSPTIKILWNSNIMASKGVIDFLHALGKCGQKKQLNCSVVLMGSFIADEEMTYNQVKHAFFDSLALINNEHVKYLGKLSKGEADLRLDEAEWVVLPSRYKSECQPLAIIEAMVRGKKIIVLDTPALRATVGQYPAIFVTDRSSLEQVIRDILQENFDYEVPKAHVEEARIRFSQFKFIARLSDVF